MAADKQAVVFPNKDAMREIKSFLERCYAPRKGSQQRRAVPVLGR